MSTLTLKSVKSIDSQTVKEEDRQTFEDTNEYSNEIAMLTAQRMEWHLCMIRCARDPLEMLRILTYVVSPVTLMPPAMYLKMCNEEMLRRRARAQEHEAEVRSYTLEREREREEPGLEPGLEDAPVHH